MIKLFRFYLCFSILLFMGASCGESEQVKEYYKNGEVKSKVVKTGNEQNYFGYYENGRIMSEGKLVDSSRAGVWIYYNEGGTKKAQGYYSNGLKEGIWTYNIDDSVYKINWEVYSNSLLRMNVPNGWILKENIDKFIPVAGFSDSSKDGANFNLVLIDKNNKVIDSVINEAFRKSSQQGYSQIISIEEVTVNNIKGKEVIERITLSNKNWISVQYFLEQGSTIYLLSFFINENKLAVYKDVVKEIAYSFMLK